MSRVFFLHPKWQKGGVETTNERWASILSENNLVSVALTYESEVNEVNGMLLINCKNFKDLIIYILKNIDKEDLLLVCQSYFIVRILPVILFLRLKGCRVLLTERNSFDQYNDFPVKKRLYSLFFPFIFQIFNKIILNSFDMASEQVYDRCRKKLLVFKNPRFTQEELNILRNISSRKISKSVYTFCRWSEQKDPKFIKTAAAIFSNISVDFTVFCNADSHSYQRSFVPSAFMHMVKYPSVLFFCSKFEGYPNLLLEARVLGLPIIYSQCNSGVSEILDGYSRAYKFEKTSSRSLELAYIQATETSDKVMCKPNLELAKKHSLDYAKTDEFVKLFLNV